MSATKALIDSFHRFAVKRLEVAEIDLTFDDLLIEWDTTSNQQEINAAIREGIADVDAGRTRPADEVMSELRSRYDLPQ